MNAPLAIGQPYQILRIMNPLRTELRDVVRILLHYVMPGVSLVWQFQSSHKDIYSAVKNLS